MGVLYELQHGFKCALDLGSAKSIVRRGIRGIETDRHRSQPCLRQFLGDSVARVQKLTVTVGVETSPQPTGRCPRQDLQQRPQPQGRLTQTGEHNLARASGVQFNLHGCNHLSRLRFLFAKQVQIVAEHLPCEGSKAECAGRRAAAGQVHVEIRAAPIHVGRYRDGPQVGVRRR